MLERAELIQHSLLQPIKQLLYSLYSISDAFMRPIDINHFAVSTLLCSVIMKWRVALFIKLITDELMGSKSTYEFVCLSRTSKWLEGNLDISEEYSGWHDSLLVYLYSRSGKENECFRFFVVFFCLWENCGFVVRKTNTSFSLQSFVMWGIVWIELLNVLGNRGRRLILI